MPQRGRSDSSWPAEGASTHLATGRLGRASSCRPLPRLFPSGEVGKVVAAAAAAVVPAAPVGVSRQPAYRSARAASSPVQPSRCGRVRRGRRALTEGGGRGQGGPWDRGPPAQRRPAPGPAGLLPWRRGHGGQREAEAGGEAPEDAAGHDRPPAQPKVLRLRPAWPHLREHDGRLLRVYLLLRQPVSAGRPGWCRALPGRWGSGRGDRDPAGAGEALGGVGGCRRRPLGAGWRARRGRLRAGCAGPEQPGPGWSGRAGDALSVLPGKGLRSVLSSWVGRGRGWGPGGGARGEPPWSPPSLRPPPLLSSSPGRRAVWGEDARRPGRSMRVLCVPRLSAARARRCGARHLLGACAGFGEKLGWEGGGTPASPVPFFLGREYLGNWEKAGT